MSRRRLWLWRLLAAVGVTAAILLLAEGLLRVAGYGYPTSFFLPAQVRGESSFVNNPRYGWRFFPPNLARECWPFTLPAKKSPGTCRIFVLGESAAMGDPDPRFGLPRMLEALLKQRFPDQQFEVVNVAFTAINSHVILPIARECARREGDLWILYPGNNEVAGPFGPATAFGAQSLPLAVIRANVALRATRFGQLLDSLASRAKGKGLTPEDWRGLEMAVGNEIGPSDPRLDAVYGGYRRNLRDILELGRETGVRILLCTMATNLRDCAPFASVHRSGLSDVDMAEWQTVYQAGVARAEEGDFPGALVAFERALRLDDECAELHFRMAACLRSLGRLPSAVAHYRLARDADALRFRADTRLNEVVRELAQASAGPHLRLFDAEGALARQSSEGLPGRGLFFDHVHLTPSGNYLLARDLADQVVDLLSLGQAARDPLRGWASEEQCRRWLGLTERNLYSLYGRALARMMVPPFKQQLTQPVEVRSLGQQQLKFRRSTETEAVRQMTVELRDLVALRPNDGDLRSNYAAMLAAGGDIAGAEREWRAVIDLLPHAVQAWVGLGRLLESQGRQAEASNCYRECLRLSPLHGDARTRLEGIFGGSG